MQLWRVSKSWLWFQSQWFKTSDLLRKCVCEEQTSSSWNRSFNHKTHFRVKTFADCGQRTTRRRGIIVHYYCWGYPYRVSVSFLARLILNQLSTIPAVVRIIPDYGVSLVHIVVIWGRDMCCWTTTASSTRFSVFVFFKHKHKRSILPQGAHNITWQQQPSSSWPHHWVATTQPTVSAAECSVQHQFMTYDPGSLRDSSPTLTLRKYITIAIIFCCENHKVNSRKKASEIAHCVVATVGSDSSLFCTSAYPSLYTVV